MAHAETRQLECFQSDPSDRLTIGLVCTFMAKFPSLLRLRLASTAGARVGTVGIFCAFAEELALGRYKIQLLSSAFTVR